jgi:hypothetical protein
LDASTENLEPRKRNVVCVPKKGTADYNEVLAIMENNPPTSTKKKSKNKIEKNQIGSEFYFNK